MLECRGRFQQRVTQELWDVPQHRESDRWPVLHQNRSPKNDNTLRPRIESCSYQPFFRTRGLGSLFNSAPLLCIALRSVVFLANLVIWSNRGRVPLLLYLTRDQQKLSRRPPVSFTMG